MLTLGLNETLDQLNMANSVQWYHHLQRREGGDVLRKLEFEGQRKKERVNRTWKTRVEKDCMNVGSSKEDAFCRSRWIVGINQNARR